MPAITVVSVEYLPGVERREIPLQGGKSFVVFYRRARFVLSLGFARDQREVEAEMNVNEDGSLPAGWTHERWTSRTRPILCKFRTGTRLWPNEIMLWPPTAKQPSWSVNWPPVANSNRNFLAGWNDASIDDRYFSRHIGARAR